MAGLRDELRTGSTGAGLRLGLRRPARQIGPICVGPVLLHVLTATAPIGGYARAELGHGVAAVPNLDPNGVASGCISIHDLTAAETRASACSARPPGQGHAIGGRNLRFHRRGPWVS
jgi:hypothetical protein